MIRKTIGNFADRCLGHLYGGSVIASIEGIPIVSLRSDHTDFLRVITLSFDLLRDYDPKRLRRIVLAAEWVVDRSIPMGARAGLFQQRLASIEMDFEFSDEFGDDLRHAAYYAALMVHEATHGMLRGRGFEYTEVTRMQTERICVAEENRFLTRLVAVSEDLADSLKIEFDPNDWEEAWSMSPFEGFRKSLRRAFDK